MVCVHLGFLEVFSKSLNLWVTWKTIDTYCFLYIVFISTFNCISIINGLYDHQWSIYFDTKKTVTMAPLLQVNTTDLKQEAISNEFLGKQH